MIELGQPPFRAIKEGGFRFSSNLVVVVVSTDGKSSLSTQVKVKRKYEGTEEKAGHWLQSTAAFRIGVLTRTTFAFGKLEVY